MKNYISINGKQTELTDKQLKQLGIEVEEEFGTLGLALHDYRYGANLKGKIHNTQLKNEFAEDIECSLFKKESHVKRYIEIQHENTIWNQISRWVIENDDGWRVDWDDDSQTKWHIYYAGDPKLWFTSMSISKIWSTVYMSEDNAKKLVEILNKQKIKP